MKTKGITIWERHAEKFVLAVAALLFVGFAAMQFIGEPNAVSTSEGPIAPDEIDELLEDRARELRAKLSDDADAGVELPDPVPALDQLLSELDRSLSPAPTLRQWSFAVAPSVEGDVWGGPDIELPVPEIKVPARVAVGQTADALADGVVESSPELQELFPDPDQPHDLNIVVVAAPVDLADIRRQFRGDGDSANVIPSSWFNDRPENIVDVVIEREEFDGSAWTDPRTLDPIPDQVGFRSELASGELDAALRDDVLSHATTISTRSRRSAQGSKTSSASAMRSSRGSRTWAAHGAKEVLAIAIAAAGPREAPAGAAAGAAAPGGELLPARAAPEMPPARAPGGAASAALRAAGGVTPVRVAASTERSRTSSIGTSTSWRAESQISGSCFGTSASTWTRRNRIRPPTPWMCSRATRSWSWATTSTPSRVIGTATG
ncbi:MAG: hypothetical protein ACYS15_13105 [Planctomycetota bacterium]|jgi:hypothetical protein